MALRNLRPNHSGAATHALVIGVGEYRHFSGGAGPINPTWGLRQLPGAAISAKHFVDWLEQHFHHPEAPLATIEYLISGPEGAALNSEEPLFARIQEAFDQWHARTSSDPQNIAMLYFCGHGVLMGVETALLASDFGNPASASLVRNAIHVEGTVQGMFSSRANRQCFIIDACRTTEEPLVKAMASPGTALATATTDQVRPASQPILFASGLTEAAYQMANEPSPFTSALIESLNGLGVDDVHGSYEPGECQVTTAFLLTGIKAAMKLNRRSRPFLEDQTATAAGRGSFDLHYPRSQVLVPFIVGCDPGTLNATATISVLRDGQVLQSRPPALEDLELRVAPDSYVAMASLPDRSARQRVLVTPPFREGRLRDFVPIPP